MFKLIIENGSVLKNSYSKKFRKMHKKTFMVEFIYFCVESKNCGPLISPKNEPNDIGVYLKGIKFRDFRDF